MPPVKELCHPKILFMWRSGNPSQQELVRCLYTFMLHGKNITDTAKALFIHRNTLTYRLERLSELFETDFNQINSDTLFYLLVSCMLLVDSKPLKSDEAAIPET
ncbi:helix-turn-helix domain-containing protein [Sporomusa sp.]|uniref:PucR family transcriptional regulator n=1 Tax=Sporomusa sp. TaxID=2078658 RepID=UPI002C556197|nr:helix-turn-helix domain-containing protein [Sporomusa sp.]